MTKYRIISNGYWEYLQYATEHRFLWHKYVKWHYVPKPCYDSVWGRDWLDEYLFVNSLEDSIEGFIKEYPDINAYWPIFNEKQRKLEEEVRVEREKIENRKSEVKYF